MIVEDGTGLTDSNSYVSVVFADDYFSTRGVSKWETLSNTEKEQMLIKATDYIDGIFQWKGKKLVSSQALRFPRENLYDYEGGKIEGVPTAVKQATCEAASLIADGTILFQTADSNGDVVSEKIGELAFTYSKKQTSSSVTGITPYDSINTKLRGLFIDPTRSGFISGKVARV